jgi:hypothetical protein
MAHWPWELKPLTARVVGGWVMLPGAALVLLARDGRWNAARYLIEAALLWDVLTLLAFPRARTDFDFGVLTWVYLAVLALSGALLAALIWRMRGAAPDRGTANRVL